MRSDTKQASKMTKVKWESQSLDEWTKKHAKGKFVNLEGHKTHYLEQGDNQPDKNPVILLHGFFYDSFMWASNIDTIAKTHKVYAPELWGFGYSTRQLMDYSYELYAKQLLLFMDELGIQQASLIGQSLGGGIVIKFATEHPDRVDKLVLVDAAGMPNKLPLMAKIINKLPALGNFMYNLNTDSVRKQGLLDFFVHDKKFLTDEYFENVTRFHKIKGTVAVMLDIMQRDFFYTLHQEIKQLSTLNKDTLIVWGKHDKGNPLKLGQDMHQILTGSKLEVFDNAKHVPNSEQPEKFNQVTTNFLNA